MARAPLATARLVGRILAAGAVLWLAQSFFAAPSRTRIVVDDELRAGLRADHARRTGRAPSAVEEQALLDAWIDDEVLYREALALGLDRGDVVIRRRLVQSMGFLLEGESALGEPSDAELGAHLAANPERFAVPPRLSFVHVYLPRTAAGDAADAARLDDLRARLVAGADPARLGVPFARGARFVRLAPAEIDGVFGPGFAERVAGLTDGTWSGPVPSSFGAHLVRVDERLPAGLPELAQVRAQVAGSWREERRRDAERAARARLRERYEIASGEPASLPDVARAEP